MKESDKVYIKEIMSTDTKRCMLCGKCSARCPSFKEMDIKPHQFVDYINKNKTEKLLESKSIWKCLGCMECVERCPRGVAPMNVIETIRTVVLRAEKEKNLQPEDIPEIVDELVPQQLLVTAFRKLSK